MHLLKGELRLSRPPLGLDSMSQFSSSGVPRHSARLQFRGRLSSAGSPLSSGNGYVWRNHMTFGVSLRVVSKSESLIWFVCELILLTFRCS